jgi:hypothetical protein
MFADVDCRRSMVSQGDTCRLLCRPKIRTIVVDSTFRRSTSRIQTNFVCLQRTSRKKISRTLTPKRNERRKTRLTCAVVDADKRLNKTRFVTVQQITVRHDGCGLNRRRVKCRLNRLKHRRQLWTDAFD